jgi:hypothetical protein
VGLVLSPAELLGSLDDVVPRTPVLPPIAVRPYVFTLRDRPALQLNPEVAATSWAELDLLLHPDTYRSVHFDVRGERREFPAYQVEEAIVWGMTERILTSLFEHLRP